MVKVDYIPLWKCNGTHYFLHLIYVVYYEKGSILSYGGVADKIILSFFLSLFKDIYVNGMIKNILLNITLVKLYQCYNT